jgi:alkylglycerol monooxygenase
MEEKGVNYIALAIPVFFLLIGIEFFYGLYKKKEYYRFNDFFSNMSQGIGSQIVGVFAKTILFFGYLYLYNNHRFFEISFAWYNWLILFLGVDFLYYWFHRMSHEINAMWAAHIVHHQSEEYNLSVALRQSWFQSFFSWFFYLPLAIIGYNPIMFIAMSSFNTLYQFWIHTKAIDKMGWFEKIFNTPSHHRVHHASDPKYIDKNHAGSLIIWDKMFGTFAEEIEEPVYGITSPLKSWNPIWANFHYWIDIFKNAAKAEKWKDKIRFLFAPPGWQPDYMGGFQAPKEVDKNSFKKYDRDSTPKQKIYIAFNFVVVLGLATWFLFLEAQFSFSDKLLIAIFIIASLTSGSALFEKKTWFFPLEVARLFFGSYLVFHFSNDSILSIGVAVFFILLFAGLNQVEKQNSIA